MHRAEDLYAEGLIEYVFDWHCDEDQRQQGDAIRECEPVENLAVSMHSDHDDEDAVSARTSPNGKELDVGNCVTMSCTALCSISSMVG